MTAVPSSVPGSMDRLLAPGALTVLFQPIVENDDGRFRLSSVESLVRGPKGTNLEPAEILFDYVRRKREEVRMDRACVAAICTAARALPPELAVSINVHSATIAMDPEFARFLVDEARAKEIEPERLTVEIVEHESQWVGAGLTAGLGMLRSAGVGVALDDIGLGQSSFKMIVDCRPDSFKLDAYFVGGLHADPYRQAVIESVVVLAEKVGARVVAEGVEERADLDMAVALGVSRFQGFLFSRGVAGSEIPRGASSGDWLEGLAAMAGVSMEERRTGSWQTS